MQAYVELKLKDTTKELKKKNDDKSILIDWIVSMSKNQTFYYGCIEDGSFAIIKEN